MHHNFLIIYVGTPTLSCLSCIHQTTCLRQFQFSVEIRNILICFSAVRSRHVRTRTTTLYIKYADDTTSVN